MMGTDGTPMAQDATEPLGLSGRIKAAEAEAKGIDLAGLAARSGTSTVTELTTPKARADRKLFLLRQLGNEAEAELAFERVLAGNDLQPVNYLERGATAARPICRVTMRDGRGRARGFGSGFLIAPGVLITNNHVIPDESCAQLSFLEFDYAMDPAGDPMIPKLFKLAPPRLFFTSKPLDFTVVAVEPTSQGGGAVLNSFGTLPLIAQVGKVVEGEWLTIIQHPAGDRKALAARENRFLSRTDDVLWYTTDTLGGSSGSPVFNNDWQVVALHHAGVPERDADGNILTTDGSIWVKDRDSEERIKWIANAGIRVSRIVDTLKAEQPAHPMLQSLFEANLAPASGVMPAATTTGTPPAAIIIAPAAQQPLAEAALVAAAEERDEAGFDPPLAADYASRPGYDPAFLGPDLVVPLPTLSPALRRQASRLLADRRQVELKYLGYTAVQHAARRLPIHTAANVDFAGRFAMSRPRDQWRLDPRIAADEQLGEFYYKRNKFDRGHMTRREDMEYGATRMEALERATDTMHFTNCAPQHSRFNQAKATWQGLELHLLEDSILRDDFRAMVMTGPVLTAGDPVWERFPDIQYPVQYWKVAVAWTADRKPFAAAFVLDQAGAIAQFGIEEAKLPFEPFQTFQVPVADVETLTGLRFRARVKGRGRSLSAFDPLAKTAVPLTESSGTSAWVPLPSPRSIVRG